MRLSDGTAAPDWLRVLARRGAFLRLTKDGAEAFSPRNQFSKAVARVDRQRLAAAMQAGLLRDLGDNRLGPSPRGLAALRAARLEAAGPDARDAQAETAARTPMVNPNESPLAWLRRRRDKDGKPLITQEEFNAGERLRADFWFAQLTPRVTSSWDATVSSQRTARAAPGAGIELQDHIVAARERVRSALRSVGPELSGILVDVCCDHKGLEDAERAVGWPQRSGKVVLQLALTRLARHYGFLPSDEPVIGSRRAIRHWGTDDYRPSI